MFVHGDNIAAKESTSQKYADRQSQELLAQIRQEYDEWRRQNMALLGPSVKVTDSDNSIIARRVALLNHYKDFVEQQIFAEHFDSRSNLQSSVLEEFLFYLFKDLVLEFGSAALIGKSHAFKDIFFTPPNYSEMVASPYARIEKKDHDFTIGVRIEAQVACVRDSELRTLLAVAPIQADGDARSETIVFDIPAVAIECKTYLDKTMLEGCSTAAEELKSRNPNALYLVLAEWLKLTSAVNLNKYKVDQIYVLRKQKNTDREYRFLDTYQKNPIYPDVVQHLYELVRRHLTTDWEGTISYGLSRGWLI